MLFSRDLFAGNFYSTVIDFLLAWSRVCDRTPTSWNAGGRIFCSALLFTLLTPRCHYFVSEFSFGEVASCYSELHSPIWDRPLVHTLLLTVLRAAPLSTSTLPCLPAAYAHRVEATITLLPIVQEGVLQSTSI